MHTKKGNERGGEKGEDEEERGRGGKRKEIGGRGGGGGQGRREEGGSGLSKVSERRKGDDEDRQRLRATKRVSKLTRKRCVPTERGSRRIRYETKRRKEKERDEEK